MNSSHRSAKKLQTARYFVHTSKDFGVLSKVPLCFVKEGSRGSINHCIFGDLDGQKPVNSEKS